MVKHISCFIDGIRKKVLRENTKKLLVINENWNKIVDERTAQRTEVIGIKQKIIYVRVESPALLNELSNFRRNALLEKFRLKYPSHQIRDIKFII
jgi:hypothetical protein